MDGSGAELGYRPTDRCLTSKGIIFRRDEVRLAIRYVDPEEVDKRKR